MTKLKIKQSSYIKYWLMAFGIVMIIAIFVAYMTGMFSKITLNQINDGIKGAISWKSYRVTEQSRKCESRRPERFLELKYLNYCENKAVVVGIVDGKRVQAQKIVDYFFSDGWVLQDVEYYGKTKAEMKEIVHKQLQKLLNHDSDDESFDFWISHGSVTANLVISSKGKGDVSDITLNQYNFSASELPEVSPGELLIVVGLDDEYLRWESLPFPIFKSQPHHIGLTRTLGSANIHR